MAILAPITRSPGKLSLIYSNNRVVHRSGVNFIDGIDIEDVVAIRADATELAEATMEVLPVTEVITAWQIHNADGVRLYTENFATPFAGQHGNVGSGTPYYSISLAIPGRGAAVTVAGGSGGTIYRLYTRQAYLPVAGERFLLAGQIDGALSQLVGTLNGNLRYYADFYGQHADTSGTFPVQFNAYVQRHTGS